MRHLISGEDCAIAGEATAAVAAAPAADTFRKSRRFIFRSLLAGAFPLTSSLLPLIPTTHFLGPRRTGGASLPWAFNTDALAAERDNGMTGGDKSRMSPD